MRSGLFEPKDLAFLPLFSSTTTGPLRRSHFFQTPGKGLFAAIEIPVEFTVAIETPSGNGHLY